MESLSDSSESLWSRCGERPTKNTALLTLSARLEIPLFDSGERAEAGAIDQRSYKSKPGPSTGCGAAAWTLAGGQISMISRQSHARNNLTNRRSLYRLPASRHQVYPSQSVPADPPLCIVFLHAENVSHKYVRQARRTSSLLVSLQCRLTERYNPQRLFNTYTPRPAKSPSTNPLVNGIIFPLAEAWSHVRSCLAATAD